MLKWGLLDPELPVLNLHAEVEIDGRLCIGDVVFTDTIRDYYKAQMHLNSRFNRCIIHVSNTDESTNLRIRLRNGKPITTVIIKD